MRELIQSPPLSGLPQTYDLEPDGLDLTAALTAVFDVLQDAFAAGDSITIKGFGTFSVADRNARAGKNPQTGEAIEIAARRVPTFKPGKAHKDAVASGK